MKDEGQHSGWHSSTCHRGGTAARDTDGQVLGMGDGVRLGLDPGSSALESEAYPAAARCGASPGTLYPDGLGNDNLGGGGGGGYGGVLVCMCAAGLMNVGRDERSDHLLTWVLKLRL